MSNGVCLLILIFCFLCGGLDIFMAVASYKKGKYFGTGMWLTTWVTLLICLGGFIMEY